MTEPGNVEKIKIGISACLLGRNVRYDGGHQWDRHITETLGKHFSWMPVCPEVEYGLPVPREAMRLVGDPAAPHLVAIRTGIDHTAGMQSWAAEKLQELKQESLCGFIFKSKSPSSGMTAVKVFVPGGRTVKRGVGVFAAAFMARFPLLPVEEDGRLHDPALRENFIERVFVYRRWQLLMAGRPRLRDLERFHREHKLLVMSHSVRHLAALGRLVANHEQLPFDQVAAAYPQLLMGGLKLIATPKKQTNVLMHILGCFKKVLTPEDKEEMLALIECYRLDRLPLIVPLTMLTHYVRKFSSPYLQEQLYLNPHPAELMLRNHG